ncbi:LLM class flavin-dependent oxidoreductase [Nocardia bovistercoris]|uniref:LLM class flavin-dependent oxidoreductase n=1 Tax=Nocardia bovistercoris TaxID=2785916 RepID=A0A931N5U5_9NOCA|nr:LLM class flavin-dependent oxidoreductase [Nocardia bovistercoris]MBH0780082.1 LLM class flavin-dependent oxidoreductase [Nocardia bovistercoris]
MSVPLSILDLAPVSAGSNPRQALRNSVDLARHAEDWGYHRYWLAEHHFVAVASSSTITLIGQVAAATKRIRVGSAAVQAGFHTSAAIVEAFGTIDAFHPGRLDLGLGRSAHRRAQLNTLKAPASDRARPPVRTENIVRDGVVVPPPFDPSRLADASRFVAALDALIPEGAKAPPFADQVAEVIALLDGTFTTADGTALHAVPGEGAQVEVWLFGSSGGESAALAGRLGLPFAAAYHVAPGSSLDAVDAYRAAFRPSRFLAEPYVVISADAVVAADDATARAHAEGYGHWVHSIRGGGGATEYPAPNSVPPLTPEQRGLIQDRLDTQFVGAPATVVERLSALQRVTDADEVLVTTITHDHADRLESYRLLAEAWGLRTARAA